MDQLDKMINNKREEFEHIKAPEVLEQRLISVLSNTSPKKGRRKITGPLVAACLALLLFGYNFDTLAYYSSRIMGYGGVMNGTLRQLNELGKGQIIDKSYTFNDGLKVTLDAVMMDDTQLLAFYTIEVANGKADDSNIILDLAGGLAHYMPQSGQGISSADEKSIKWVQSFEPPHFFEKSLTFGFSYINSDTKNERGEIKFDIDRQKAMGNTLKANIHKTIKLDSEKIYFDTILASPTKTVINGKIQNILELVADDIKHERIMPKDIELKLYANDMLLQTQGGGMSTDMKGITFHTDFDALPEKLESLKLELVRFTAQHEVNEVINIDPTVTPQKFNLLDQQIIINKIEEKDAKSYITITTDESVVLSSVYLLDGDKTIQLNKTIEDTYEKTQQGEILHTRTLEFEQKSSTYKLNIKTMTYSTQYNQIIELPIR